MSYRDRDPRDYRSGNPQFGHTGPDQYGQEHYGRRRYNPQHEADTAPAGPSQYGHREYDSQFRHASQRGGQSSGNWPSREPGGWQETGGGQTREPRDWRAHESRDNPPFSREPSGHAPFTHAAFGESNQPRYFGTGSQGYGGGPSFTGGTYGMADWRSDAPYFDEVGFIRGNYEDPLQRESDVHPRFRQSYGVPNRYSPGPQHSVAPQQRRYPNGPKGYTRSDERLREDISERLMQAYDIDSSDVTVQVLGGKVVLEGTVPSRHMKHAIEDIADAAPGVQDVDNRVRLASSTRGASTADAGSSAQNANNTVAGGATSTTSPTSNGRTTTTGRRDS